MEMDQSGLRGIGIS